MNDVVAARALHVLAVVIWIGGVSMATTVILSGIRRGAFGEDWLRLFEAVESRFVWQARTAVLVVGLSGLYMTWRLNLWDRFASATFWWMHAMVVVWSLFFLLLFVAEPLVLHRHLRAWVAAEPEATFRWLHRAHWVLLILSMITILGAVAGNQGWSIF